MAGLGVSHDQMVDRWRTIADLSRGLTDQSAFTATFGVPDTHDLVLGGSCEAALLFGSVSPTIDQDDALKLARLLLDQYSPDVRDGLSSLVHDEPHDLDAPPWQQGYELAALVLDDAADELVSDRVQIEEFLDGRGVQRAEVALSDRSIRAVSFASPQHTSTVALNTSSRYADSAAARRFTLAHELCHLLFDRTRGARLAVASGPWAPLVTEQRANAFAAMLLMPPDLFLAAVSTSPEGMRSVQGVGSVATQLGVSVTATVDHAYNLGLIDEVERDELREGTGPAR